MVRRAAAVLGRRRALALAGLTAAVAAYAAVAEHLWQAGLWPDVLFASFVLFPATFALIWLVLPVARLPGLLYVGLGLAAAAIVFRLADLDVLFNLAKLFALSVLGFWFLSYFETVAWAVLVAAIIPWVDVLSVWRGPTRSLVEDAPEFVDDISLVFRLPGGGGASLGPPDILFFALFLGAASRFNLRVAWTWVGMTGLLGVTLVLAASTLDVLAALPAICVGFLLPNADLIWHALRRRGRAPVRIYGRADGDFYDLDADVIERSPSRIVLLTRDRPPLTATIEPVHGGDHFATDQADATGAEIRCRLTVAGDVREALVHDLPNGLVIVLHEEHSTVPYDVHPEQLAADEAKVERLRHERR